ncbi:MAG: helix-turn-helix protein [Candidatus Hydrogenedentota bacterium]
MHQELISNLSALMQARELNQSNLAKLVGVSQKTISNILRGSNSPTLDVLERISAFFEIPVAVLLSPNLEANLPPVPQSPAASTARDIARLIEDFLLSPHQAQKELLEIAREKAQQSETYNK